MKKLTTEEKNFILDSLYHYSQRLYPDIVLKNKIFNLHKKISDSMKTTNEKFFKKGGIL